MKPHYALRHTKADFIRFHRHRYSTLEEMASAMRSAGLYSPATKTADIVPGLVKLARNPDTLTGKMSGKENTAQLSCSHENWAVRQYDRLGFGRCLDCHQAIPLAELFEVLKKRAETFNKPYRAERALTAPVGESEPLP